MNDVTLREFDAACFTASEKPTLLTQSRSIAEKPRASQNGVRRIPSIPALHCAEMESAAKKLMVRH